MFHARVTVITLSTRVPWLHCVSGAFYEGEETCRQGCIAPLFTQYKIENNVECFWTFAWYFDLNVLLFVWLGNETFAPWRQLPRSLWALVCDYDQFWSLAGRVAHSAEAMPNFSFFYVTSNKNQPRFVDQLFGGVDGDPEPRFNRLLPKCVCLRGSTPDPALLHTPLTHHYKSSGFFLMIQSHPWRLNGCIGEHDSRVVSATRMSRFFSRPCWADEQNMWQTYDA